MFRTADAFRLHSILLCGISGRPPHPELHKTALGAEESVAWSYEADIDAAVAHLKGEGWHIAVLEQAHGSISLYDFKRQSEDEKIALVVGNEVEGVKQSVVDAADYILEIPQEGTKHSLNVSVSAGMAIYEICRRW
jgi:tRNA G18 (ribose-2'-O)-methylase SpoU